MWFHVFILNTLKMMIDAAACCCSVHEAAWPCHLCHVFFTIKYIIPDYSFLFHWERIRFLFSCSWDALLCVTSSLLSFICFISLPPSPSAEGRPLTCTRDVPLLRASERRAGQGREGGERRPSRGRLREGRPRRGLRAKPHWDCRGDAQAREVDLRRAPPTASPRLPSPSTCLASYLPALHPLLALRRKEGLRCLGVNMEAI